MKKRLIVIVLLILIIGGWVMSKQGGSPSVAETVEAYYRGENGLIRNYPEGEAEYLSESIGLYLDYLVLTKNEQAFQQEFERLDQYRQTVNQGELLKWKAADGVQVNALIDDVRIAHALLEAATVFKQEPYKRLSLEIQNGLIAQQFKDNNWHDFYDWSSLSLSNQVHFSYFNHLAWEAFGWDEAGFERIHLAQVAGSVFYAERYNTQTDEVEFIIQNKST